MNSSAKTYAQLTKNRLLWLVRLRWFALAGVSVATIAAALGLNPGINLPVLSAALAAGLLFNLYFWHTVQVRHLTRRNAMFQVLVDIGALTLVLWAGGGPDVPFKTFYFFHIIIGGILVGPQAAVLVALAALSAVGFVETSRLLPFLQISTYELPNAAWEKAAELGGLGVTVAFIAYFVTHVMDDVHAQHRAITAEREKASDALARLTFTLDRMDAGMEVLDQHGHRTWNNQTFQRLFPNVQAKQNWQCPGTQNKNCDHNFCPVVECLTSGKPHRCTIQVGAGSESPETYELLSYPLSSEHGSAQVINLYVNRTRERTLQKRVDQAEKLAAFGRLAQGLAHELNTPLGTINALADDVREVLEELGQSENNQIQAEILDMLESCGVILHESRRCKSITSALLQGRDLYGEDAPRQVQLRAILEHSCVVAFSQHDTPPKLQLTVPDDLNINTDPDRLTQVMLNLLGNARDAAGESGEIIVTASGQAESIQITVADNGPGIPPEAVERIFEPFFTTKDPGQGTGLGLYTCYLIVQRMGGQMELGNSPEGGAIASLWLPRHRTHPATITSAAAAEMDLSA